MQIRKQTNKQLIKDLFSRTTWVSQHQKGSTNLDCNEARDDGVAVTSAGPYEHHLHLSPERYPCQHLITQFFTGCMLFLTRNQQRQSNEGNRY